MGSHFIKRISHVAFAFLTTCASAVFAGTLTDVTVTSGDDTADTPTTYTFNYTLATDILVADDAAVLYVSFPTGFDVNISGCADFTITVNSNPASCGSENSTNGDGGTASVTLDTDVFAGDIISVQVSGITNPAIAGDYDFDPFGDPVSNPDTGIRTVFNTSHVEIDKAPLKTVAISSSGPVNGTCGPAHGKVFSFTQPPQPPNYCATGDYVDYGENATTFYWTCNGRNGGTNTAAAACSARVGHNLVTSVFPPDSGSVVCVANPVITGESSTCTHTAGIGYSFDNWSGDCSGAVCAPNNVTANLTITANFKVSTYAVTAAVNPTTAGTVSCTSNSVTHGDNSSCSYVANPGYTFINWSGDCTGATCALVNVTAAKSVTANFTAPTFAITTAVSPSGAGTANCTPNPVNGGSSATCAASANTGYSFTGWSGDCTGGTCALIAVGTAKSVTANFAVNSYSISGAASPVAGGAVTCSGSVNHGSNGNCSATATAGYTFAGWSGCTNASGNTCNFTNVTANQNVTATFTLSSYTVTGAVSPAASGGVSCISPVNHGASTSCTATPATGFSLTGWTGCTSSSDAICTLSNVTADTSVSANFAVSAYTLSGSASPTAGGSISCTSPVIYGATGTCTATVNAGYTLDSWSGCSAADGNSCTVTNMTANKTVSATFVINSYTVTATANPIDAGSATCTGPVNHGASASCTANAAGGYRLANWSGACTGSSCTIASVTANSAVTANFELLPTYNVATQVTPADSGKITCTQGIAEGSSGTCTAKASSGYRFKAWGGDCSGTEASCTLVNVINAKSVSATFEQATSFNITASLQPILGSASNLSMTSSRSNHVLCSKNPVALGETVTCRFVQGFDVGYGVEIGATRVSVLKGWGGECTRVEGDNCIIENISTDKQITVYSGLPYTNKMQIIPAGAGSVWCNVLVDLPPPPVQFVQENCRAEPNSGYEFESFSAPPFCAGALCPRATATFKQKSNTPVVNCDACNSSTTNTDTTTTKTASKTTEPDEQGTTTQLTVSTTTNTVTSGTTTNVGVGTTLGDGQPQIGGNLISNDPNTQVTMNNDNTVTASNTNTQAGTSSTTIVSPTGTSTSVFSDDTINRILALTSSLSQTVTFNSSSTQTSFTVSGSDGLPLGTTTVSGISTSTQSSSSLITTTGTSSTVSYTSSNLTVTASLGGLVSTSVSPIASSQTTSIIAGNISSGLGGGFGGGFGVGLGASFTVSSGGSSMEVTGRGGAGDENLQGKPGLRKTSAADDNREVLMDVTGDNLQSIQLSSDSAGLVEFFKPGTGTNTPQMTHIDVMSDSVSLTLTYPVAQ